MSVSMRPVMLRSFTLVVLVFIIVLAASSVAGCFENTLISGYSVDVYGLANYNGDGSFRLLVPMPMWNGTPEYTAEQVSSGNFSILQINGTEQEGWEVDNTSWSASPVETEHGWMIAFTPKNSGNLSDFRYYLGTQEDMSESYKEQLINEISSGSKPIMLSNTSPSVKDNYSADNPHYAYKNDPTYTSYIYIGHGLSSARGPADSLNSHNIRIVANCELNIIEEQPTAIEPAYTEDTFETNFPQEAAGWIPVTVDTDGYP